MQMPRACQSAVASLADRRVATVKDWKDKQEPMTFAVGLASLIYGGRFLWGQIVTGGRS